MLYLYTKMNKHTSKYLWSDIAHEYQSYFSITGYQYHAKWTESWEFF